MKVGRKEGPSRYDGEEVEIPKEVGEGMEDEEKGKESEEGDDIEGGEDDGVEDDGVEDEGGENDDDDENENEGREGNDNDDREGNEDGGNEEANQESVHGEIENIQSVEENETVEDEEGDEDSEDEESEDDDDDHGGPIDKSVLTEFKKHVAYGIWRGKVNIVFALFNHNICNFIYAFFLYYFLYILNFYVLGSGLSKVSQPLWKTSCRGNKEGS